MDSDLERRMTGYLLGRLSEQEEADLESRYFEDEGLFVELLAIEAELRDAYEHGELSPADQKAFERRLLSSARHREKQAFSRALSRRLRSESKPAPNLLQRARLLFQSTFRSLAVVSAALIVLAAGAWWASHKNTRGPEEGDARTAARSRGPEAKTLAVVLTGGLVRGGGQLQEVVIARDVTRVRLEARVKSDFAGYEAALESIDSKPIAKKTNLKAEGAGAARTVALNFETNELPSGDYILTLRGLRTGAAPETVAEYAFRVTK